jgi:hypothetical protein
MAAATDPDNPPNAAKLAPLTATSPPPPSGPRPSLKAAEALAAQRRRELERRELETRTEETRKKSRETTLGKHRAIDEEMADPDQPATEEEEFTGFSNMDEDEETIHDAGASIYAAQRAAEARPLVPMYTAPLAKAQADLATKATRAAAHPTPSRPPVAAAPTSTTQAFFSKQQTPQSIRATAAVQAAAGNRPAVPAFSPPPVRRAPAARDAADEISEQMRAERKKASDARYAAHQRQMVKDLPLPRGDLAHYREVVQDLQPWLPKPGPSEGTRTWLKRLEQEGKARIPETVRATYHL